MSDEPDCPLVIVSWEDSRQPASSWLHLRNLDPPRAVDCQSVGWLLRNKDGVIQPCPNMGDIKCGDLQISGVIQIPVSCVTGVRYLKEGKPVPSYKGWRA